jgi:hypothetical protein
MHVSAQSIVLVPATSISSESKRCGGVSFKHSFLYAPFVAPQPHIPLSTSFHQIQTTGTIIAMDTAAPQVLDLMNILANATEAHVEEIIKALKALPQCIKATCSAEATKMRTTSGVKKSPSKKERAKQENEFEEEAYFDITQQTHILQWTQRSSVFAIAGEDLLLTLLSTPVKKVKSLGT